ncbi:MAG: hypothetical protein IT337_07405 [Thermomicrobiales bacterium]|nr:hypothetical protein [Thermomicrobiales bacterium]
MRNFDAIDSYPQMRQLSGLPQPSDLFDVTVCNRSVRAHEALRRMVGDDASFRVAETVSGRDRDARLWRCLYEPGSPGRPPGPVAHPSS